MDKIYDHIKFEKEAQKYWEDKKTFLAENNPGPLYSIDTPPPTVSGSLHIGHIFSYTHTDIIARYKRMSGLSVFYPFGFDNNGLATEKFVEKKYKINSHSMPRSEFIQLCLKESEESGKKFKELWQKIGLSVDWNLSYSTISAPVRKISQESFIELYKKGLIYRQNEPALYCINCRTSVAQAELEDKEIDSFFNDIVFKTEDGQDLIIGTTRPELLSSCVALFFNPKDKRYTKLKDKFAITPIFEQKVPILEDENVDIEKGTGLVMCCTFGDKTDIYWAKKYNLPYKESIGRNGRFTENTGILKGLKINEARKKILEELKERGLLIKQLPIKHAVNVHERCKKEIEFIFIKQWFLKILNLKEKLIEQGEKLNWYPKFMKSRYTNWVENVSWDWCLSRQRYYGIPFPIWYCKDCGEVLLPKTSELPVDPQESSLFEKCPKCSSSKIIPEKDVMDTWNTSSLTPYICYSLFNKKAKSVFEEQAFLPMGMRPQAHDIIRTWLYYTIIKALLHNQTIPWKDVIISGYVLSTQKEKISKSKGNTPTTPEELLKRFSADSIRYWAASGVLGQDVAFSENQLKIGQRLTTKIWNAFRFTKEYIQKIDKQPKKLGIVNEWILQKLNNNWKNYKKHLDKNEFSLALDQLEKFFWKDFCDNYLEIIKDQLFNPEKYEKEQIESTEWTLYNVGLRILQLYSPYLPHITEAIYQKLYKENISSIHQTKFKAIQVDYNFKDSKQKVENLINLISQIRKLKTEKQLSLKTEIEQLEIYSNDNNKLNLIKEQEQLIKGIAKAQNILYKKGEIDKPTMEKSEEIYTVKVII